MNIDALLQPLGWREFERSYFRQRPLILTGPEQRFSQLVTTDKLNAVLSAHRFTPRRLTFVKAGASAPRQSYLWDFKEDAALVRADGVRKLVEAGYHLNLNGVDELWSDVRAIAEAWEPVIGSYVAVNLYAVWAGQQGFKIHVDGHDTLLLQVAGRKHWSVYAPDADIDATLETQRAQPVISTVLTPGHLLYIPKGWWHVGHAEGGHSVHLTVGVDGDPTSLFLQWCTREWKTRPWAAQPLPWPATTASIETFLSDVAETLRRELTPDTFRRFREWKGANTAIRPRLAFEYAGDDAPLGDESLIHWLAPAQISESSGSGEVSLTIGDWTLPLPAALLPAVRRIQVWPPVTWRDLSDAVASREPLPLLENWISAMALGGHVAIESPGATISPPLAVHA